MKSTYAPLGPRLTQTTMALAVFAAFSSAHAQQATNDANTIVVTGFRASLESALNKKREDSGIVDVIKAEDIAKFPDTNLAESLQRIPGVVIDRDAGEGRSITVRGLGSDFTRVRINGMEALATTGATDSSGGTNRGRGFDFNVFASELFNSITVRKSSSADVEEGSLGATVDLQTARPLDYKGFTATVSVKAKYNDMSESTDPRLAFLIANTNENKKFGWLLSGASGARKVNEEGFSAVRWDNGASSNGFCPPLTVAVPTGNTATATNCAGGAGSALRPAATAENLAAFSAASSASNFHPRLPRYGRLTHDQDRVGFTGAIQARPADGTLLTLEMLYAKIDATRQEDFIEAISFSRSPAQGGKAQTRVVSASYDANGSLLKGVFDGVDVRSESRYDELSTTFTQPTFTLEQDIGESLHLNASIGRAISRFNNPVQTTTTLDARNVNGYSIDFSADSRLPAINWGTVDVSQVGGGLSLLPVPAGATSIANTTASEIRVRPQGAINKNSSMHIDLAWEAIPDKLTVKFGGDQKSYKFSTFEFRRTNQSETIFAPPGGESSASLTTSLSGFGNGLSLPAGTATSWVVPNLNAIAAAYNIYCNCLQSGPANGPGDFTLTSTTNGNARVNNRSITEDDEGLFLMADFKSDLFGLPVRGNLGTRHVHTETYATGYVATGGGTEVVVRNSYNDWLPSVNLATNITKDFIVRLAAAKVMSRPSLGSLSPGGSVSTAVPFTITSGNPLLKPFRAKTLDASFEWYFDKNALLGLGLFHKKIGTYIQTLRATVPYNQTGLPLSLLPSTFTGDELYQVTAPINTDGGNLDGFELNYQQPFTFLPGVFKNTGMLINYTKVKSKIAYAVSATSTAVIVDDLLNLSPKSWNTTLYYDDGKFSARASASYRSAYLQNVPGRNNSDVEGKNETLNFDASISYKVSDKLEFTLEGVNLTNEANDQFVGRARNSASVYHVTGREFLLGARYKF